MLLKEEIIDIFSKKEELHPELKPYLSNLSNGIPALRHPLVYSIFHTDHQNAFINRQYEERKKMLKKAIQKKDYEGFIYIHERPYRLQAFCSLNNVLSDKKYWEILGSIWTDSENIWQNRETWKELLSSKRPHREFMMDKNERQEFVQLPEQLVIYRGYLPYKNKNGFSYTLDEEKAEWFSKRFHADGKVLKKTIFKSDAIAYFTGRNEKEIVII